MNWRQRQDVLNLSNVLVKQIISKLLEKMVALLGLVLSLVSGCIEKGVIQYEFMHALGFTHEQNRPDREDYVTVFKENVIPKHVGNFKRDLSSKTLGSPHYESTSFRINRATTIQTNNGEKKLEIEMKQQSMTSRSSSFCINAKMVRVNRTLLKKTLVLQTVGAKLGKVVVDPMMMHAKDR